MHKAIPTTGRRLAVKAVAALALSLAFTAGAQAQQKYEMKVAYFVTEQHPVSQWLERWAAGIAKASGGRITVKSFPNAQMGPPPVYYDLARTGQAEVTWFLSGGTPGRFPVTELINLPYLVGSSEIGTKVLNDPELRAKYTDAEHKGIKVLLFMTHQPGQVFTTKKAIRTVEDMKGMRIRFSSPTIRDFVGALGATPVGVAPTEIGEQMQKGTIDGAFMDYGGAGIGFKLGGTIKYATEMYSFVASFGIAMNPDFYNKLPADLKKVIDDSVVGIEKEVGDAWDLIDGPGKKLLVDGGAEAIKLSAAENAKFRKIGAELSERHIKELEAKGLPARAVYNMMRALAEKHAKTSRNFWN
ncbi:MAG: TRAP transporter substrate-binding protein [Betaproteobacteria bacterium]|nr:TRAP transporter substrate-binding protein [Betaproteobacteria bacterium]